MKKKLIIGLVIFMVIFVGGLLVIGMNLGKTVKLAAEKVVPSITGCDFKIEKVTVSPISGKVNISGMLLGNPKGYKTDSAIAFSEFSMAMDIKSIFSDKIVIHEVILRDPLITYEMGLGNSNIGTILKTLEGDGKKKAEQPADPGAPADSAVKKKVVVDYILIEGAKVKVSAKLAQGVGATLPLPKIEIRDVGKDKPEGASILSTVALTFSKIAGSVFDVVRDAGLGIGKGTIDAAVMVGEETINAAKVVGEETINAAKGAGEAAKEIGKGSADAAKEVGKGAADAAKQVGQGATDAAKEVGDTLGGAVKGLFGSEKEKK